MIKRSPKNEEIQIKIDYFRDFEKKIRFKGYLIFYKFLIHFKN